MFPSLKPMNGCSKELVPMGTEAIEIDLDKLEGLFDERHRQLVELRKGSLDESFFIDYCDKHGIVMVHRDWVRDAFNEPRVDKVCIWSPEDGDIDTPAWLLVPREFAERAMILGVLP